MNMVGTPCSPVQRSASTASSVADRVEALRRANHRRAVGDASQIAQHHAEAMIIGHRDAQPVVRRQPHRLADEIAVVEDVVVGQRRALGRAGGAGGELDVDGIVELQRRAENGQRLAPGGARRGGDVGEIECPAVASLPRRMTISSSAAAPPRGGRARRRRSRARSRAARRNSRSPWAGAEDQRPAADFSHRIFELMRPVGRD